MNFDRGSEWRKWDLHFHTQSSYDYKDKSITDQDIINKLVSNNISAIAITDHHTIDIARIKNLQLLGEDKITILPGIEFCSELGGSESVHFIGIFPENTDIASIWTILQGKLGLTELDIKEKGGYENIQCDLIDTCDLIHELGGITSIHAGSKTNSIESIKNNLLTKLQQKKRILSDSIDILELGKEVDMDGYDKIVFPSIGFSLPMVICSDNHDIKDYSLKQNLWIKADTTFEGLKQIIFEPEDRVKIQELKPDEKAGYQVIESILIKDPDFHQQTILLNANQNSIIGGRSTGKSILLGAIAKKLDSNIEVKSGNETYNTFIDRVVSNIEIHWQDKQDNLIRDIEYFPQGFMFKIAKDFELLRNLINKIIIQDRIKESVVKQYQAFCNDNSTLITNNINKLVQIKKELEVLQTSLKEKGDIIGIEKEVIKLETELDQLSKQATLKIEEIDFYNSEKEQIDSLKKQIEELENEIIKIESLKSKYFATKDIEFEIVSLSDSTQQIIKKSFDSLFEEFKLRWTSELDSIVNSHTKLKQDKLHEISIKESNDLYKKGIIVFHNNVQHREIENKLRIQKDKLADIKRINEEILNLNKQVTIYTSKIREDHELFHTKIFEIKDSLTVDKENLKIEPTSYFNISNYKSKLNNGINQQSYQGQEIVNFNSLVYDDYKKHINSLFDKLIANSVTMKGGYSNISFLTELLSSNYFEISYNVIYDNDNFQNMSEGKQAFVILKLLLEFSTKTCPILIDQPEDDLDNRAIYKELATYLKKKKKERQIVLVTHNPNIAVGADSELIIVANQNGGASKNIANKKFQYKTGSLENTMPKTESIDIILNSQGIKEHVCEILEGGNEAFKQRERKYAILIKKKKA